MTVAGLPSAERSISQEMKREFAAMRPGAVLVEIDRLPDSQRKAAALNRD
jgi:hypothetical protein